MKASDFAPLNRSSVGFDRLFDLLQAAKPPEPEAAVPPFDVERIGDDRYRVTLAVPGFGPEDLSIVFEPNLLRVVGRQVEQAPRTYLHRGIPPRAFQVQFDLADFVRVDGAAYDLGLLIIELRRELPEVLKPRRIPIATAAGLAAQRRAEPASAARRQTQEAPVRAEGG